VPAAARAVVAAGGVQGAGVGDQRGVAGGGGPDDRLGFGDALRRAGRRGGGVRRSTDAVAADAPGE
jgi:hypothetical protein